MEVAADDTFFFKVIFENVYNRKSNVWRSSILTFGYRDIWRVAYLFEWSKYLRNMWKFAVRYVWTSTIHDMLRNRTPFRQLSVLEDVLVLTNFLKLLRKENANKTRMNLSGIKKIQYSKRKISYKKVSKLCSCIFK